MSRKRSIVKRIGIGVVLVVLVGFLIPERSVVPVAGATVSDWNENTLWYEPWGASGVHKGIDVFAPEGTGVLAATGGLVVFQGSNDLGGNIILIPGPKWRFHYYAHLASSDAAVGGLVSRGERIGTVGSSGLAVSQARYSGTMYD